MEGPYTHKTSLELSESDSQIKDELGLENTSVSNVLEKTDQSARILSQLWDKRFDVLGAYYGERNRKRFNPSKSDLVINAEGYEILSDLEPINQREERVLGILRGGAIEGLAVLENASLQIDGLSDEDNYPVAEFNKKVGSFSSIIKRYTELTSLHEDILGLERELIASPDDKKMELYLKRLDMFSSEFSLLASGGLDELKEYFSNIEGDLKKVQEALKQGKPLDYLKQSLVSAVVRVVVSNMAAGFVIGDPLKNPYFWQLMAATVPTVLAVNYIDYYFKIFTKITQKINKLI